MYFNSLQNEIQTYVFSELTNVTLPNDLKPKHQFKNLSTLIGTLFRVLDNPIAEEQLQGVGVRFYEDLKIILESGINALPQAIEGLASNLEAYLKLIAYYRYNPSTYWSGDTTSKGLKQTMFSNLTLGQIEPHKKFSAIKLPIPLINYSGGRKEIFDFIRTNIRNNVHNAVLYKRSELLQLANVVISGYLLATDDNELLLKQKVFPEYKYLQKIIESDKNVKLNSLYVDLLGKEVNKDIDVLAKQVIDESTLISNLLDYENLDSLDTNLVISIEPKVDKILSIATENSRLHIIGEAGSGKSTVLLKILANNAAEIFKNGDENYNYPFYINANEYRLNNTFAHLLSKQVDYSWFSSNLKDGKIQLLVDGLNEIPDRYKSDAYQELSEFIAENDKNSFVFAERKLFFKNSFGFPVFELKELQADQVKSFINKYAKSVSEILLRNIYNNQNLAQLSHNPLTLKMLIAVSKNGEFPINRGLLFKSFINAILNIENLKGSSVDSMAKIDVLTDIAWQMKSEDTVSVPVSKFKQLIGIYLPKYTIQIGILDFYKDALNSLILSKSAEDEISFYHETYQEYFAAVKLKQLFEVDHATNIEVNPRVFETILICSELFPNETNTIKFFEKIYTGSKLPTPKPIKNFSNEDVGDNIILGAKIAFSLKQIYPKAYEIGETYILNLCKLWKFFYQIDGKEIIPIETLFSAVGNINSENVFNYLLGDFAWIDLWLSSADNKSNVLEFTYLNSFETLSNVMVERIIDFLPLYQVLNSLNGRFFGSGEVVNNIKRLENKLLYKQGENALLKYYNDKKDFKIFLHLIRIDIDYLKRYQFDTSTSGDNEKVLNMLIRYHINLESIRALITKEIINIGINLSLINFYARVLIDFKYDEDFFILTKLLYTGNIKGFESILVFLQNYNFQKLPIDIRDFFVTEIPNNITFEYSLLKDTYFNVTDDEVSKVLIGREYCLKGNTIQIRAIAPIVKKGEKCAILSHSDLSTLINLLPKNGYLRCTSKTNEVIYEYTDVFLSRTNKKVFLSLKDQLDNYEVNMHKTLYKVNVNDIPGWKLFGVDYRFLEDKSEYHVKYGIVNMSSDELKISDFGTMSLKGIPINLLKPKRYHRDIIKSSHFLLSYLERDFELKEVQDFVSDLGIKHMFISKLEDLTLGVVYESLSRTVNVFDIKRQKLRSFNKSLGNVDEFKINDLIFLEDNLIIIKLEDDFQLRQKANFLKGEIVMLNHEKREGFISCSKYSYEEDFYFSYNFCNYLPIKGDEVSFLPAINTAKNFKRPMAVGIAKLIKS